MSKEIFKIKNINASISRRCLNKVIDAYNEQFDLFYNIKLSLREGKSIIDAVFIASDKKYSDSESAMNFYKQQLFKLNKLSRLCKRYKSEYFRNNTN